MHYGIIRIGIGHWDCDRWGDAFYLDGLSSTKKRSDAAASQAMITKLG